MSYQDQDQAQRAEIAYAFSEKLINDTLNAMTSQPSRVEINTTLKSHIAEEDRLEISLTHEGSTLDQVKLTIPFTGAGVHCHDTKWNACVIAPLALGEVERAGDVNPFLQSSFPDDFIKKNDVYRLYLDFSNLEPSNIEPEGVTDIPDFPVKKVKERICQDLKANQARFILMYFILNEVEAGSNPYGGAGYGSSYPSEGPSYGGYSQPINTSFRPAIQPVWRRSKNTARPALDIYFFLDSNLTLKPGNDGNDNQNLWGYSVIDHKFLSVQDAPAVCAFQKEMFVNKFVRDIVANALVRPEVNALELFVEKPGVQPSNAQSFEDPDNCLHYHRDLRKEDELTIDRYKKADGVKDTYSRLDWTSFDFTLDATPVDSTFTATGQYYRVVDFYRPEESPANFAPDPEKPLPLQRARVTYKAEDFEVKAKFTFDKEWRAEIIAPVPEYEERPYLIDCPKVPLYKAIKETAGDKTTEEWLTSPKGVEAELDAKTHVVGDIMLNLVVLGDGRSLKFQPSSIELRETAYVLPMDAYSRVTY